MTKTTIKIGGIHCAGCVNTIETSIKKLNGISEINVNLGTEKAYITYDPKIITLTEIKKTIEAIGYQYLGTDDDTGNDDENEKPEPTHKLSTVFFGFFISIILMLLKHLHSSAYLMFIVATPAFLHISFPIFRAAYHSLKNKNLNMDVMYSMGIGIAFIASIMSTSGIILSTDFLFYETAIMLASFLILGRYLETRAKSKTSDAIKKLINLKPQNTIVIRNGSEIEILTENVQINDIILVEPGEKVPVDGEIIYGSSYVDGSMITGESIPVLKKTGDKVVGGTINKNSILKFKATKIGKDTVLSQIITLVEEAQSSKLLVQKIADKVVSYFIPVVLGIAILSFIVWSLLGSTLLFSLTCLISVLVVACPCALGLATPTAVTVGLGRAAELGILIKNSEVLETAEKTTTVMFDKTGTLTKGKPEITDIISIGMDENMLLQLAASVEKNSQHPFAEAMLKKTIEKNIELRDVSSFDTFEGKGVTALVDGKTIIIGNRTLFNEKNIPYKEREEKISALENEGKTAVLIANDGKFSGIIAIADTLKETTKEAVKRLLNMNLKLAMITGDNTRTATAIAKQIGIERILAEVFPKDKSDEIKKLQSNKEVIAFVGDGINDAPALAQADVGIAIGSGTDIAIESGEIVLIKDNLMDVVNALELSKKVMSRIKQNIFWAFAYNTILIPVAAGALYPIWRITFKPELAGLAMAMSSVTVVTLSLMLKRYTPKEKTFIRE